MLRGNDGGRDIKRRFGRFLARIEPPSRLDTESIKEAVKDMRSKTESALKEIKVPNVEDLRNLIDDIRAEQSEAKYHPDRRRLSNVADFFAYTEEEGACADDETTDEASRRGRGRAEAETETETEAFRGRPGARVFDRTRRLTRT